MINVSECINTLHCKPNTKEAIERREGYIHIPEVIIDMIADYVQDIEQYIIALNTLNINLQLKINSFLKY